MRWALAAKISGSSRCVIYRGSLLASLIFPLNLQATLQILANKYLDIDAPLNEQSANQMRLLVKEVSCQLMHNI
jgi:hypothetical protein